MLAANGLCKDNAMARFHLRDAAGNWHTGAGGFIELWSHLPSYRWLAGLLRSLHLVAALDRVYSHFARWRLRRRCDPNSCNTDLQSEQPENGTIDNRRTRAGQ